MGIGVIYTLTQDHDMQLTCLYPQRISRKCDEILTDAEMFEHPTFNKNSKMIPDMTKITPVLRLKL